MTAWRDVAKGDAIDVVEVAADMLKKALPGFESRIVPAQDALGIRGALPIGAKVSVETILFPVYHTALFEDGAADPDREYIERQVEPVVARIAQQIRRHAIAAVGLEEEIDARVKAARDTGYHEGFAAGHDVGVDVGRRALLAELTKAAEWASAQESENE